MSMQPRLSTDEVPSEQIFKVGSGVFYDGHSAARKPARLRLRSGAIEISVAGLPAELWPLNTLRALEAPEEGRQRSLRLSRLGHDARLVITDPAFVDAILARRPQLRRGANPGVGFAFALGLAAIATIGALLWGVFAGAPVLALAVVSPEQERSLGRGVLEMITKDDGFCPGKDGEAALQGLADRLLAHAPAGTAKVRVHIADDPMVNAFALPGGELVILRGLITKAARMEEGPDVVAGVLAHELGHAVERHPLQGMARALGLTLVVNVLTGGSDVLGTAVQLGGTAAVLSYNRGMEQEADDWAARLLTAEGISPAGLAAFFAALDKDEGADGTSSLTSFLSTHPVTAERTARFRTAAAGGRYRPALDAKQWQAVRSACGNGALPAPPRRKPS